MASTRSKLDEIVESFSTLEDPRSHINRRHPLPSILVIAVLAVRERSILFGSRCDPYYRRKCLPLKMIPASRRRASPKPLCKCIGAVDPFRSLASLER
jgi:hypothetical protein